MCVHVYEMYTCGGERSPLWSQFSPTFSSFPKVKFGSLWQVPSPAGPHPEKPLFPRREPCPRQRWKCQQGYPFSPGYPGQVGERSINIRMSMLAMPAQQVQVHACLMNLCMAPLPGNLSSSFLVSRINHRWLLWASFSSQVPLTRIYLLFLGSASSSCGRSGFITWLRKSKNSFFLFVL